MEDLSKYPMKTLKDHKTHSFISGFIAGFMVGAVMILVFVTIALS